MTWNELINTLFIGSLWCIFIFATAFMWHAGKHISDMYVAKSIFEKLVKEAAKNTEYEIDDPNESHTKTKPKR